MNQDIFSNIEVIRSAIKVPTLACYRKLRIIVLFLFIGLLMSNIVTAQYEVGQNWRVTKLVKAKKPLACLLFILMKFENYGNIYDTLSEWIKDKESLFRVGLSN